MTEFERANPVASFFGSTTVFWWQREEDAFWSLLGFDVHSRESLAEADRREAALSPRRTPNSPLIEPYDAPSGIAAPSFFGKFAPLKPLSPTQPGHLRHDAQYQQERDQLGEVAERHLQASDFKLHTKLGKGRFGDVFLTSCSERTNELFACKTIQKSSLHNSKLRERARNERYINGVIGKHPFVVAMRHAFATPKCLCLVLELATCGELFGLIRQNHANGARRFGEKTARFYIAECVIALEFIHSKKVLYRDLKPENVLIAEDGHVRISDFGLSKPGVSEPLRGAKSMCGTPEYLAPEILRGQHDHGLAVDWWALGALSCELVYGAPPFYTKDKKLLFDRISSKTPFKPPTGIFNGPRTTRECTEFITSLLNKTPVERLGSSKAGAKAVEAHKFLKDNVDMRAIRNKQIKPPLDAPRLVFTTKTRLDWEDVLERPEEPGEKRPTLDVSMKRLDEIFKQFDYTAPPREAAA